MFGGLGEQFEKSEVETKMGQLLQQHQTSIKEIRVLAKLASLVKVEFTTPTKMWDWLKSMKDRKVKFNDEITLWHSVDKPEEERVLGKKISLGLGMIRPHVKDMLSKSDEQVKKVVDADWVKAFMYVKMPGFSVKKLIEKPKGAEQFQVATGHEEAGIGEFDLATVVKQMNEL